MAEGKLDGLSYGDVWRIIEEYREVLFEKYPPEG